MPPPKKKGDTCYNRRQKDQAIPNRHKAFELFKMGWTYRQIAENLGVTIPCAHTYVQEELGYLKDDIKEMAHAWLDIELRRLEDLMRTLQPRALQGDVRCIDRVLKIMERKAKFLGLDAPEKKEISGKLTLAELIEESMGDEREGSGSE